MSEKKRCTSCKFTKPLTDFHKDSSRKDGLSIYCKCCVRQNEMARATKKNGGDVYANRMMNELTEHDRRRNDQ